MSRIGLAAGGLALLAAAACSIPGRVVNEGMQRDLENIGNPTDPLTSGPERYAFTDLREVLRAPTAYKGRSLRFYAVFSRFGENIWVPFHTPFTPDSYSAFSAWPEGAKLWQLEGRLNAHPLLFLSHDNFYLKEVSELLMYTPIEICGVVSSDYSGRPWIEVERITPRGQPLYSDASLRLMMRGMEEAQDNPAQAVYTLEDALHLYPYPPEAELEIHLTLGRLYADLADWRRARRAYRMAMALAPENPGVEAEYDQFLILESRALRTQFIEESEPYEPPPPPPPQEPTPGEPRR